ncbi:hypothetical protein [Nocardia jiangxiensis]|uniref:hypothetical protein n=1 Tax=Nocardia jiangxiensis TaxID=282685 RepID=UPI00059279A7|nr:hypothetical protein [Nocardia jiangxiensis]
MTGEKFRMKKWISVEKRSDYIAAYTRFGSISIDKYGRTLDKWWKYSRNRIEGHSLRIRIWKFSVDIDTPGKSYVELTGCPDYSLGWILDEFDSSFNDIAIASLKYHQSYSVCYCDPERFAKYQDLIDRLGEPGPRFTDEEMAILHPPGWTLEDELEPLPGGGALLKPSPPEKKAVFAAYRERETEHHRRIQQARHDFVDIMPQLWS